MDRRDFIKKSALVTMGSLLMASPLGRLVAKTNESDLENEASNLVNEPNKTDKKMKVLLINGSPRRSGNTFTALSEMAKTLEQQGIEAEVVHIGVKPIRGCIACGQCHMNVSSTMMSATKLSRSWTMQTDWYSVRPSITDSPMVVCFR